MKRLDELSPAQLARLPEIRDEWLRIGLSTERADRPRAVEGIRAAYVAAGFEPPKIVVWLNSPFAGAIGAAMLATSKGDQVRAQVGDQVWAQVEDQVWAQVGAQVWDQVGDQVRAQVGDQVWDQVGDQVRAQVGAQVWAQVEDQVWAQVGDQVRAQVEDQVWAQVGAQVWDQVGDQVRAQVEDQVWSQVGAQVWDQVGDQVRAQVRAAIYGQHEAGWLSFYAVMQQFGIEAAARLDGLGTTARSCGWWWPFRGLVVVSERPCIIGRDDRGRLHGEQGPALLYPDGWAIWAWHGVRVTRDVIEHPETITADRVRAETNIEQRRVLIERMGAGRYLQACGAKVLDIDTGVLEGGATRCLMQDDRGDRWLVGTDGSTTRVYSMSVPRDANTCREAHEAIAGLDEAALVAEA